jgi:TonB family protein
MSSSLLRFRSASLPIVIVLAAILAHLAQAAPAGGQEAPADLTALLARPISPGAIALLAQHAGQPGAQKRLVEAVKHDDPAVRAVAARIAFVTQSKGLASALISAVAKEEHAHTAAEQVRALMGLLGAPGDQIVLRAVTRVGGPTVTAMADSLARTRPADIPGLLPTLVPLANPRELGAALATACAQHPSSANDILQAILAAKQPYLFESVIESLREAARPVPAAVLMQALQSPEAQYRSAVIWHLFFASTTGDAIPDEVVAAAAKPVATGTAAAGLTWDDYGRELLGRYRGSQPTAADWAGLMSLPENIYKARALPIEAYARMTNAELKVVDTARGDNKAGALRRAGRDAKRTDKEVEARTQVMRTIPVFAKGLVADMLAVNGCRPPSDAHFAAGNMTYRPDGAAKSIELIQAAMPKECQAFVRGMMVLTLASPGHPIVPDLADYVLLPFERRFLECVNDPVPPARPRELDMTYEPPRDGRVPSPNYPEAARRINSSGGVVRLRARLSHTGCVTGVETIRSVHPLYDFEAIQAMIQGRYTPAKINGTPVDSFVNWSIQFYAPF